LLSLQTTKANGEGERSRLEVHLVRLAEQENVVKRVLVVLVCAVIVETDHRAASAQNPTNSPPPTFTAAAPASETMQIDGSRNPELIPEWSAWGYAFRVIANGPGTLPKAVHEVVSKDETALVVKEAQALQKIDRGCQERVLALHPLLGKESYQTLDAKLRTITLVCLWATLHARDRVLDGLNPAGATALAMYVESTKAGTSLSIRKKDLARFLEPQ
jgi:hypothetical protein